MTLCYSRPMLIDTPYNHSSLSIRHSWYSTFIINAKNTEKMIERSQRDAKWSELRQTRREGDYDYVSRPKNGRALRATHDSCLPTASRIYIPFVTTFFDFHNTLVYYNGINYTSVCINKHECICAYVFRIIRTPRSAYRCEIVCRYVFWIFRAQTKCDVYFLFWFLSIRTNEYPK